MGIVAASFTLAALARFNFEFTYVDPQLYKYHLALVVFFRLIGFLIFQSYSGIVRHTSLEDIKNLFNALLFSSLALFVLSFIGHIGNWSTIKIPYSILLIGFFIAMFSLTISRFMVKSVYERLIANHKDSRPVIIYGAGHLGRITKNSLYNDKRYKYKILYFLDDNLQLNGKSIEGITILNKKDELAEFLKRQKRLFPGLEVIFAIQSISSVLRNEIIDSLLKTGVPLKILPPIKQWMNGELKASQIHEIKIEDLLEREPISLNNRLVNEYLNGKKIMVTGAAGSIGSELVRQILKFEPEELILVDQAESALYDLETEIHRLSSKNQSLKVSFHIRDVSSEHRMEELFQLYNPQVVFHAAAYKHVPLMEEDPFNAVKVNVSGTMNMANLAFKYQSNRFVFISTDKAVNPTNVMGASKRLAEKYVQSLNAHQNTTRFVTTRFGNVLGSNGSVIPLFKKQIENGGPVTVTHPDIIRYFMTIPEACQLVLEAGTMGKGGEIYVFEMGEPVRIVDLAHRMIRLSGFEPEEDILIEFTGLRPGEKLYEELLGDLEKTKATHHPKILIAQVKPESHEELQKAFMELLKELESKSKLEIVRHIKALVPEYVSENSAYSSLDEAKS
ncbi:polysaccharide biosynthesis protein [Jiulongibacter sp. NS-SX5]|uniref:polysaccharide biosynthesis protein n=1 Tax=Jiulongibacter sp. NS-SX5 TaxID=3463854 RepID=UPI004057EE71